jgi:hypothetical protein
MKALSRTGENRMNQKINTTFCNHQECLESDKHSSVATDIVVSIKHLTHRARQIAELVNEKLYPVMATNTPPFKEEARILPDHYPPLFFDLQEHIIAIENALDFIEYSLERTTL